MREKKHVSIFKIILFVLIAIISISLISIIVIERNTIKFSLLGPTSVSLEVGDEEYTEEGFIATERKKDISNKVNVKSNLDNNIIGNYTIKYNLRIIYLFVNKTLLRNVNVKDTKKPELNIQSDKQIKLRVGDSFEYPIFSATDNYDGDITSKVQVTTDLDLNTEGTYEINYVVSDSSNNVTEEKITVKVVKKTKDPYIDVSITNQTLEYYEYGELVLSSPVVTGLNDATPIGNFKVLSKARNVTLKGSNYSSFVYYWIAFVGHKYGMHDASWRSTFGGTIYKTNGSHGCINMPHDKVKTLYEMVDIGTPVNVHY